MSLSGDITQEELEVFLQEADEQLQLLDEDFIALEKEGADAEILQEILRASHTLKGSSAMLGYERMSRVAHAMEAVVDMLRNGTLTVGTSVINTLLYGLDALKSLRHALMSGEDSTVNVESVVAELQKVLGGAAEPIGAGARVGKASSSVSYQERADAGRSGNGLGTLVDSLDAPKTSLHKLPQVSRTVRVDVKILDRLLDLAGEMVIDGNRLGQIGRVLESRNQSDGTIKALQETSQHTMEVLKEIQDNILEARMLPIGTVFSGFPRLVRDLALKADKKVDFVIEGQDIELDRTIIEQIRDPLLHLLRNAVDHGIETPDKRRARGKLETGIIRLQAHQEPNRIAVTVEDDGNGIDAARVRDAVVKKGLRSAEEVFELSDAGAIELILVSGVSTAEKVTEVSGRGVGMDVVRANIEGLGGSIDLESKLGQGSRFTMRLPVILDTTNLLSEADGY